MNDFSSTASIEMLTRRSELMMAIHHFFQQRDFIHVDTPLLSHDTVVDRHIHPVGLAKSTVTGRTDETNKTLWLQTSPEFCMKRLLTSGATNIYQIAKAFRQAEQGSRHNPEFTMLEWYRVGDDMAAAMRLLSDFAHHILGRPASRMMSYQETFLEFASIDPFADSVNKMIERCQSEDDNVKTLTAETSRTFWLNYILSNIIEPKLGFDVPVIVYDWPADQSALAIVRHDQQPPVAERFELYVDGVELANGYHELRDADELVARNDRINRQRQGDGAMELPLDSRLLSAMRSGLPACAGVAVGVDRLLMVAQGCQRIDEVIAFPLDRA